MEVTVVKVLKTVSAVLLLAALTSGCGHTDEELGAKQREIDKLASELKTAKGQLAQDQEKINATQSDVDRLRDQLKATGLGLEKSKEDQARLQQALSEYKLRADQLSVIEGRFKELRAKLEKLNQIGLKVVVRNNRMVIQLPGDVLFDSGKDELKAGGKEALLQVAEVVRNDRDLNARNFLVAGHTDNAKYGGGPFNDNWGLSLARARRVLLYLIAAPTPDKDKKPQGGGLAANRWAASGYGETDPIAGTVAQQAREDQQRNRRVELVVQPNVEEMLNLGSIH
jgi:chemotaxis protein MotB